MANVIKTVLTYPLNGSNRDFNIPFEYLARKFVVVTLIGVDRHVLTLNNDYRFATRTTISTNKAWGPADGYTTIEIRRVTSATERLVDFTDGSILRAYDLNVAQIQTMHVAEEARDLTADTIGVNNEGHLDARGRRIVNVANAVDDRDAVPLGQLKGMNEGAWQARNQAQQFRNEAENFKNAAQASAQNAAGSNQSANQHRDDALRFRNEAEAFKNSASTSANTASNAMREAETSAQNAAGSNQAAINSATKAKNEADRAEREASKLANFNDFAAAVENVQDNNVWMKGNFIVRKGITATTGFSVAGGGAVIHGNSAINGATTVNGYLIVNPYEGSTEGGEIRLYGKTKERTGGFIDVDANDNLRVVKDGANGGVKMSFDTNGRVTCHTVLQVNADMTATGKVQAGGGSSYLAPDGNIFGPVWSGGSVHAHMGNNYRRKNAGWIQIRAGACPVNVDIGLGRSVKWHTIWLLGQDAWCPVNIGDDSIYYISFYGGWWRFQIHSNGTVFKLLNHNGPVPAAIIVDNE
ncbi:non-contractile tail fiber protein [Yersinia phage vB_YenP_Rambo]|uniref:Non-contractile tail fiber protein n=1 Tax=Yersinia phage vB_YenP_Rambo TaxID=2880894 RepID=A0AC61TNW7_9CAUD|nr:non-contractile tail fiber protein [Yersinia phage vB_YenP_Rambo]